MNNAPTYKDLKRELENAGCFETARLYAVFALIGNLGTSITLFLFAHQVDSLWFSIPLFILGSFFFYRIGWLMHDAAHGGTFQTLRGNERFASLTAGILGEFPSGWSYGHNKHHAHTNIRGRDMDQRERWDSTLRFSSRFRAWLGLFCFARIKSFYVPHTLIFLMLRDGYYCYTYRRKKFKQEAFFVALSFCSQLAFFSVVFGWKYGFFLMFFHTHIGIMYLNTIFAGNHYDLENYTPEEAEHLSFEELQTKTTRNYKGGLYARFIFGGLEKQLEHHLFPTMPRHQLKSAETFVKEFCEKRGLPYYEENFITAFTHVLDYHVIGKEKC